MSATTRKRVFHEGENGTAKGLSPVRQPESIIDQVRSVRERLHRLFTGAEAASQKELLTAAQLANAFAKNAKLELDYGPEAA